MDKRWLVIAGISGCLGVAFGAFGAHGLRGLLSPDMLDIYKTGILYQLIHSVVLLALALSGKSFSISKWFFLAGIILFSFSLYLYSLTGIIFFTMITPIGGILFLTGWLSIVWIAIKLKSNKSDFKS